MPRSLAAVVLVLVAVLGGMKGVEPAAWGQPLPMDPRLVTGECDNGLRYMVVRHVIPPGRAMVWLHVKTGSLNETPAQRGAAHYISHLAFDGSASFPPGTVAPLLESFGMRAGPDINASTNFESSVYKLSLNESNPEAIGKALRLLGDIAGGSLSFAGADVEKERAEILAEQKHTLTLEQRVQEQLWMKLAPGSLLGQRDKLGLPETIQAMTVDELKAFYARWYVPSNMTVVFVGDADPEGVVALIRERMGAGPKEPVPAPQPVGVKPYSASLASVITDSELAQTQLYIFRLTEPQPPVRNVEDLRARILDSIALNALNRRLENKGQSGQVKFEHAQAFSFALADACQLIGLNSPTTPGAWQETLASLGTELQRARLHGLYPSEVEEVKAQLLDSAMKNAQNERLRQGAAYVAALSAAAGTGDAVMSAQQTADLFKTLLPAMDVAAVSERLKSLVDPSAVMFVIASPPGPLLPTEAQLLQAGTEAMAATPDAQRVPEALMTSTPTPGTVVEESDHAASGVWSGWLDNGTLVHYRFMTLSPGQATITVAVAGGLIKETDLNRGITEASSVAWSRPATSSIPSYAVQELTKAKKIRVGGGPGIDNLVIGVSGEVADLETGMQLVHLMMTDPVIEAPGLEKWKAEQIELADDRAAQAKLVFSDGILELLYPASELRPRPLTAAQVARISLDKAQAWLRHEVSTGPIEVSVVGDITKERALELVNTYVGSLPKRDRISASTFDELRNPTRLEGPQSITREVTALAPEASYIFVGFHGVNADNMHDSRLLGIAAQVLTARLGALATNPETPLQKAAVQSQPAQEFPGFGIFGAFGITALGKGDAAIARVTAEFDAMANDGPSVEELAAAKQQIVEQMEGAIADPGFWSAQLSLMTYRGLTPDDLADAVKAYDSITPKDVQDVFKKYYSKDGLMHMVMDQKAPATAPIGPGGVVPPIPTPAK